MENKNITLEVNGCVMQTESTKKYENRSKWSTPNPKHIKAFIPGTTQEVNVKAGDSLKKGDVMFKLIAMKMENLVVMPFDGVIKSVNVTNGSVLAKNFVMIEIE